MSKKTKVVQGSIAALFVLIMVVATSSGSGASTKVSYTAQQDEKASYTASIDQQDEIDPATLGVALNIKNTGSKAGTPSCEVTAQSADGTHSGVRTFYTTNPINPGDTYNPYVQVTITGQGADTVTDVKVDCQ